MLGIVTVKINELTSLFLAVIGGLTIYLIVLFRNPALGILSLLITGFVLTALGREIGGFNYGILVEGILIATLFACIVYYGPDDWKLTWNDLTWVMVLWFVLSVLELFNPAASFAGAVREFRSAALYPLLTVLLSQLVFRKVKYLDIALLIVLLFSLIAALNGIKQHHWHLSPGEQQFLEEGGYITHVLWGQLRVFSMYSDAGQFGASQAHVGLMALILACGPFKWWKRLLLLFASFAMFYGMLISGTRGALFALVAGVVFAVFLTKNYKAMFFGGSVMLLFICFLKFTTIGNTNYDIYRLRTALDPQDASLNVRFNSQKILGEYLQGKPFGDGLGTMGYFGMEYNGGTFLSTIQPDSYWVKIWGMYGIVGFTIWICIMMYILGKCCGIVWKIEDKALRVKLIALTSGIAGILFCSYGNEVINNQPSSFIVYISWALVFLGPVFDKELRELKTNKD